MPWAILLTEKVNFWTFSVLGKNKILQMFQILETRFLVKTTAPILILNQIFQNLSDSEQHFWNVSDCAHFFCEKIRLW